MLWFHRHSRRVDVGGGPDPDSAAVEDLRNAGAVLENPRSVQHYLITDTLAAARTANLQLREAGYESSISENPTAPGWIVVAERIEPLDAESLVITRSLMELIAGRLPGGSYDGWHAELLDSEEFSLPPELMPTESRR